MQKLILHFGEHQVQKNLYNLIVKTNDLSPQEFEQIQSYLKNNYFDVYAYPPDTIEALFQHEYIMVLKTIDEPDRDG